MTTSVISSFKYVCNSNNEIEKHIYDTFNCQATPNNYTLTNMTIIGVENYACDYSLPCDYAIACSFLECNRNATDTECNLCSAESYEDLLTSNHDTIVNHILKIHVLDSMDLRIHMNVKVVY